MLVSFVTQIKKNNLFNLKFPLPPKKQKFDDVI